MWENVRNRVGFPGNSVGPEVQRAFLDMGLRRRVRVGGEQVTRQDPGIPATDGVMETCHRFGARAGIKSGKCPPGGHTITWLACHPWIRVSRQTRMIFHSGFYFLNPVAIIIAIENRIRIARS